MTEAIKAPGGIQPDPEDVYSDLSNSECAEFQASMPQRISDGEDLQLHPHMATCERCSALVYELEEIAKAARLLMPIEIEPGEDLWSKIESKLALELPEQEEETVAVENKESASGGVPLEGGLAFEGGVA